MRYHDEQVIVHESGVRLIVLYAGNPRMAPYWKKYGTAWKLESKGHFYDCVPGGHYNVDSIHRNLRGGGSGCKTDKDYLMCILEEDALPVIDPVVDALMLAGTTPGNYKVDNIQICSSKSPTGRVRLDIEVTE